MDDVDKWNSTFMQWGTSWPTCEKHYNFLSSYNTWQEMALQFPYEPHGPVHAIIGGTSDQCGADFDALVPTFGAELVNSWKAHSFNAQKDLYRHGLHMPATFCDAATPAENCSSTCWTVELVRTSLKEDESRKGPSSCDLRTVRGFLSWAVDSSAGQVQFLTEKHTCEELLELMDAICVSVLLLPVVLL